MCARKVWVHQECRVFAFFPLGTTDRHKWTLYYECYFHWISCNVNIHIRRKQRNNTADVYSWNDALLRYIFSLYLCQVCGVTCNVCTDKTNIVSLVKTALVHSLYITSIDSSLHMCRPHLGNHSWLRSCSLNAVDSLQIEHGPGTSWVHSHDFFIICWLSVFYHTYKSASNCYDC